MATDNTLSSSGERLRRARILAGIATRREFEEHYNISANTLQGWEQDKNPLSEKGARRVVSAFKDCGLICTVEWLITGVGMPPRPYEMLHAGIRHELRNNDALVNFNLKEEEAIYKEIQLFRQHNPNAIVLTVADDAMEPYYSLGDYIGGIQIYNTEINHYLHQACIIELENNLIIPRILQTGKRPGTYTASCTNPKTKTSPLNLYNIKVLNAAPVLWHRKKLSTLR